MLRTALALCGLIFMTTVAMAASPEPREGWVIIPTEKTYADLVAAVKRSAKEAKFGIVTEAGPTEAAKGRGITIPGNRVIGVFRNDYAVNVLMASTAAMIEAPIRFYVTENDDGTATLSYKSPSFVFAPYLDEGGERLSQLASELDTVFAKIAASATK